MSDDDYEGHFDGNIAVYEVDDAGITDDVWADKAGEYDNFGQNYDESETLS